MLDGLETVDWKAVRQAFGDGTHLPEALRQLTSSDAEVRSAGYWKLDNYVVVQGALAPAALVVVPFLLEIASAGGRGTEEALDLLYELGTGYSEDEAVSVAAVRAAVASGVETYWRALEAGATPGIRSTAAFLLASLGRPELAPRLLAVARAQRDEDIIATTVLRAAEAAEAGPVAPALVAELEHFTREAPSDFLRAAGAAALATVARAETPAWVVDRLLTSMATTWPPAEPGPGHFARGEAGRPVYALRAVGLAALLRALVQASTDRVARQLLLVSLEVACPTVRVRHCWDRFEPDGPRLLVCHYENVDAPAPAPVPVPPELVRAALAAEPLWTMQSDLWACYGLPTTRDALAAWLEKETR